ncbi:hypothetical protein CEUSTIGMA_g4196.t1 [Chlamydomonas eustigma]|uniref:Uncharacterized protein n=1 Tax=Chlamydomonas eustigma TaxID=1157962 RepID=A0A250X1D5_9CHLO|nr:hypothetical protein CEUSTIGMA_g4196.t1 [Chlamydomonas eustigma]|eukprot:GAX76749.1 hypothetical protein CEUSTIGMA_g4196.t1 [Chlamydomonas eustigma]
MFESLKTRKSVDSPLIESLRSKKSGDMSSPVVLPSIYGSHEAKALSPTKDISPEGKMNASVRNLRYELMQLRNRAVIEMNQRDSEIDYLKKEIGVLKAQIERQRIAMKEKERALTVTQRNELLLTKVQQQSSTQSELEIRRLARRLKESQDTSRTVLASATEAVELSKKERNALAGTLALLAQQALGGENASTEDVQRDMSSVLVEQGNVIPRTAKVWLSLIYETDGSGRLVSPSHMSEAVHSGGRGGGKAVVPHPLEKDGSRAVAALVWQVSRLWKQRGEYRMRSLEATGHCRQMQSILDSMSSDFIMFHLMMDRIKSEATRLSVHLDLPSLAEALGQLDRSRAEDGPIKLACDRLAMVPVIMQELAEAVILAREELRVMRGETSVEDHDVLERQVHAVEKYRDQLRVIYGSAERLDTAAIKQMLSAPEVMDPPRIVPPLALPHDGPSRPPAVIPGVMGDSTSPKAKLSTSRQPAAAINEDVNPAAAINEDVNPAAAINEDVNPAAAINEDVNPAAAINEDVNPAAAINEDVNPAAAINEDVNPAAAINEDVNPAAAINEDVNPAAAINEDVNPAAAINEDVNPAAAQKQALVSTSGTYAVASGIQTEANSANAIESLLLAVSSAPAVNRHVEGGVGTLVGDEVPKEGSVKESVDLVANVEAAPAAQLLSRPGSSAVLIAPEQLQGHVDEERDEHAEVLNDVRVVAEEVEEGPLQVAEEVGNEFEPTQVVDGSEEVHHEQDIIDEEVEPLPEGVEGEFELVAEDMRGELRYESMGVGEDEHNEAAEPLEVEPDGTASQGVEEEGLNNISMVPELGSNVFEGYSAEGTMVAKGSTSQHESEIPSADMTVMATSDAMHATLVDDRLMPLPGSAGVQEDGGISEDVAEAEDGALEEKRSAVLHVVVSEVGVVQAEGLGLHIKSVPHNGQGKPGAPELVDDLGHVSGRGEKVQDAAGATNEVEETSGVEQALSRGAEHELDHAAEHNPQLGSEAVLMSSDHVHEGQIEGSSGFLVAVEPGFEDEPIAENHDHALGSEEPMTPPEGLHDPEQQGLGTLDGHFEEEEEARSSAAEAKYDSDDFELEQLAGMDMVPEGEEEVEASPEDTQQVEMHESMMDEQALHLQPDEELEEAAAAFAVSNNEGHDRVAEEESEAIDDS